MTEMREVLDFMRELSANNNKTWFDANRERYTRVRKRFNGFVEELIDGLSAIDPSVEGLRVQDCTYRINRDTRFSPDKSPYKGWLGAFIAPHGKSSGYGGYYFHIEPEGDSKWHNQLVAGVYMPEGPVLRSLREEILDNGAAFILLNPNARRSANMLTMMRDIDRHCCQLTDSTRHYSFQHRMIVRAAADLGCSITTSDKPFSSALAETTTFTGAANTAIQILT